MVIRKEGAGYEARQDRQRRTLLRFAMVCGAPDDRTPRVCRPEYGDGVSVLHTGNDGKVMFPDRDSAERAARKMARIGNYCADTAYECTRRLVPHWHLTSTSYRQPSGRAR